MVRIIVILSFAAFLGCIAPAYSQSQSDGRYFWNSLDSTGWEFITASGVNIGSICTAGASGVFSVKGRPIGYLATRASYENYRLHLEYRWPEGTTEKSNSGVLVHIASGPVDGSAWPVCFQVQTKFSRAGDLLPMAGATFAEPLTSPPGAKTPQLERRKPDSENPAGEWNTVEIICRERTIECRINGILQNRITECTPHSGRIGIQLEGMPYELRNIWLETLN